MKNTTWFEVIFAVALSLPAAPARAQHALPGPAIEAESVPTYGLRPGILSGRVTKMRPDQVKIATLIFVSGLGYFSKPTCADMFTPVRPDGSFSVPITTGGVDETATFIALLAVPLAASFPCYSFQPGVPEELDQAALAKLVISRPDPNQREIEFAGDTWLVKSSDVPVGPGGNYFSGSADSVFVDAQGRLHLKIVYRNGRWQCAEVIGKRQVGHGTYSFTLDSSARLDRNAVFGAFTWLDAERNSSEIDMLEIARWGRADDPTNAQNVVQPASVPGNLKLLTLPEGVSTTHTLTWASSRATFASRTEPDRREIHTWVFTGALPPSDSARLNFRFNLWLHNAPPSDGQEVEVVIRSFSFQPEPPPAAAPLPERLVNGASFEDGISPGSLFTIYGHGLAGGTASAPGFPLPTSLGGVSIRFNGIEAPLLYTSPDQINGQVPSRVAEGGGAVTVNTDGSISPPLAVNVRRSAPGLFFRDPGYCVAQNRDWSLNHHDAPAASGTALVAYLTVAAPAQATVGGREGRLLFLGLTPGLAGVAQANIEVPAGLPEGRHPLIITVDGEASNVCEVWVGSRPLPAPAPGLISVEPASGSTTGGERVRLHGQYFQTDVTVEFGSERAIAVNRISSSLLEAFAPSGRGVVAIGVRNPDGQSAILANAFTYREPAPSIFSVEPPEGLAETEVAVAGASFQPGATVRFGGTRAQSIRYVLANLLRAIAPQGPDPRLAASSRYHPLQSGPLDNGTCAAASSPTAKAPARTRSL